MGRPESAGTPNRLRTRPTVSVAVDAELDRWLTSQAMETGLSKAQIVRFHLERAAGTPDSEAVLKQLVIGSYGDMRMRVQVALAKARNVIADVIAVALAANPEEVDDAVAHAMREHVTEHDPSRGLPVHPYHKDTALEDAPRRKPRGRRGRRGGA